MNIFEKLPALKDVCKTVCGLKGFYLSDDTVMTLRTMPGSVGVGKKRDLNVLSNGEPIWFFKHYSTLYKEGRISKETADLLERRTLLIREKNKSILDYQYSMNEEPKHNTNFGEYL